MIFMLVMIESHPPAHLKITNSHDCQRCHVGDEEVEQVVAGQNLISWNIFDILYHQLSPTPFNHYHYNPNVNVHYQNLTRSPWCCTPEDHLAKGQSRLLYFRQPCNLFYLLMVTKKQSTKNKVNLFIFTNPVIILCWCLFQLLLIIQLFSIHHQWGGANVLPPFLVIINSIFPEKYVTKKRTLRSPFYNILTASSYDLEVLIVMVVAFQVAGKAITEQSNQIPHNTAITTSLKEIAFLKKIIFEYLTWKKVETETQHRQERNHPPFTLKKKKQFSLSLPDNWFFSEIPTFPTCPN